MDLDPLTLLLHLLHGRWILPIAHALQPEALRFGALRRALRPGPTDKVLTETLRRMQTNGLIRHDPDIDQQRYTLTPLGRSLLSALRPVEAWARSHRPDLASSAAAQRQIGTPAMRPGR